MPKEAKNPMSFASSAVSAPYPSTSASSQRNAAIWSTTDDEILLQARASGLNWQPIASRHFPNKTANACRKRHERLIERRHIEDWDAQKLELLAQEYLAVRKEMWEILASRVGERWAVVEAKCMEKGLKTLQATARTAQRRASASQDQTLEERGIPDHNSDSGIGLGSEAEMEVDDDTISRHAKSSSWHAASGASQQQQPQPDHGRSKSLPQPLPLYQPPPPVTRLRRDIEGAEMTTSPLSFTFARPASSTGISRYSPDSIARSGISIQSVLAPVEPQRA